TRRRGRPPWNARPRGGRGSSHEWAWAPASLLPAPARMNRMCRFSLSRRALTTVKLPRSSGRRIAMSTTEHDVGQQDASQDDLQRFVQQGVADLAAASSGVMVTLGHRLGLYRTLAELGPTDSAT